MLTCPNCCRWWDNVAGVSTLEEPGGREPDEAPEGGAQPAAPAAENEAASAPATEEAAVESEAGSTLERGEEEDPLEADEISVDPSRIRRAPRFGRFVLVGILLGLLVALVQTKLATPESIAEAGGPWASNAWGFFWLMSAIFVPIAALLMCGLALFIDRRSRRGK